MIGAHYKSSNGSYCLPLLDSSWHVKVNETVSTKPFGLYHLTSHARENVERISPFRAKVSVSDHTKSKIARKMFLLSLEQMT